MEAARKWVETIDDPTRRDDARLAFIGQLSWRDPKAAAELMLEFRDSPRIVSYLENTTRRWASSDPKGAYAWAQENLPEGEERGQFLGNLIGKWADNDPKAAAHLSLITDVRSRAQAYARVGYQMAQKDIDGAMEWLNSQGEGPERDRRWRASPTPTRTRIH